MSDEKSNMELPPPYVEIVLSATTSQTTTTTASTATAIDTRNAAPTGQTTTTKKMKMFVKRSYAVALIASLLLLIAVASFAGVYFFILLSPMASTIKTFEIVDETGPKPFSESIEIDLEESIVIFRQQEKDDAKPGPLIVIDYHKSMIGIYNPTEKSCFLIGGIPNTIFDPTTLSNILESNTSKPLTVEMWRYEVLVANPIADKRILPTTLKEQCADQPVFWLQPVKHFNTGATGIQKRQALIEVCISVWGFRFCWSSSNGFSFTQQG